MRISNLLEKFATSKVGKRMYQWAASPGKDKFINNTLPQIETVFSTACYVYSTAKQKNIDEDRKSLLQIQNIGSGALGLVAGTAANRWISKQTDELCKHLDPQKLDPKTLRKVSTGLRIAAPLASTALIMRFVFPVLIAAFSGKAMDKVREKRQQKDGLDVKA